MIRATRSILLPFRPHLSQYLNRKLWSVIGIGVLFCCVVFAFAPLTTSRRASSTSNSSPPSQGTSRPLNRLYGRLALQPEADRQRRRLGKRFLAPGREVSTLLGTVSLGTERHTVQVVRNQNDGDERMTIALDGGPPALTWSGVEGAKSNGNVATGNTRALIERLALDSPDQFILAQLRGASYFTVTRAARPAEVGASAAYSGPVWDLVRVAEPSKSRNKPLGVWRLYYINTSTGLIDKAISQEQGRAITADISGWINQGGEMSPTRISWKQNKQTVMEMTITNISYGPKQ